MGLRKRGVRASHSATVFWRTGTRISPLPLPSGPVSTNPVGSFNLHQGLCSITTMVLPCTMLVQVFQHLVIIGKCRPVVGFSSDIHVWHPRLDQLARYSFTRCASPPDRVVAIRPGGYRVRQTSIRVCSLRQRWSASKITRPLQWSIQHFGGWSYLVLNLSVSRL